MYGGAELYLRNLSEGLLKRGIETDVCTTKAHSLTPFIKSGAHFDNRLSNETINGIKVVRFPVIPQSRYLSLVFEKMIQAERDREEQRSSHKIRRFIENSLGDHESCLADGWNEIDHKGNRAVRWTKSEAVFFIRDTDIKEIGISLDNPGEIPVTVQVAGSDYAQKYEFKENPRWDRQSCTLPDISGIVKVTLSCSLVRRPLRDFRTFGVAVSGIDFCSASGNCQVDIENDFRTIFRKQHKLIPYLMRNACDRPKYFSWMFDYLRGPWSPDLALWLRKNISGYDVVLAQMFPFNTVRYSFIAKKFGKPLVLLPLMHADDEFYHWNHYFRMIAAADCVLAMSDFSKSQVYDSLKARSCVLGAGIDPESFENRNVSGARFREKYRLEGREVILTVGRKSPQKRYADMIQAVGAVRKEHPEAVLVMIGPDEDNKILAEPYVKYLGQMGLADLVDAYDACDVFAMMSESESFGMVFCEAWMRKKPVIGNRNCGAVSTLIDDRYNGLLCSDVKELTRAILALLEDRKMSRIMGERGYQKVTQHYTWDCITDRVVGVYENLTESS
ncbi:glycosyltransferase involved in cell wall biosynthesis [Methanolinea mesophila]|nr:glycosyltransferase involved in cell wall biosynthesis [Methanolinea mesophila]